MGMMDEILRKAKADPQIVAFPEIGEEKILKAAQECAAQGICKPMLVGKGEEIKASAAQFGIDMTGISVFDTTDEAACEEVFNAYGEVNTEMSAKAIRRKAKDDMYVALMMLAIGKVDVMFAGMSHTTGEVIWGGQTIVGLKEGVTTVSSIGVSQIPGWNGSEGDLLIIGDSAVCVNPDPADLASIAVSACDTARDLLGWEPRCAMVSYSTDGSAESELVDKVRKGVEIARQMRPTYAIDGEFQLDAAIVPAVAAKKVKRESPVAGKANIIIWPDLNVGNIGVKLLQIFGHADAYGPVLQGFKKIVCDCSRSAPVSEIVGNVAIAGVRAQNNK